MKRFLFIFVIILLALFGLKMLPSVQQAVVEPWTSLVARVSIAIVQWIEPDVITFGRVVRSPTVAFGISVDPLCSGLEACIVLTAGILAFPATWGERLLGLLLGFIVVQAVNLVRIVSLFFIGQWNPKLFDIAHLIVWQALIMLTVIVIWLLWVRYVGNNQRRRDAEREAARTFHWPLEDVK